MVGHGHEGDGGRSGAFIPGPVSNHMGEAKASLLSTRDDQGGVRTIDSFARVQNRVSQKVWISTGWYTLLLGFPSRTT